MLARLLAEAPKSTVFVGHSLDLAVKLIEVRKQQTCFASNAATFDAPF